MRKVLWLIVCLMTMVIGFASCSNIESDAKRSMKQCMEEIAKNPRSLEISNIKTLFKNDSCVVLTYFASGQNGFGGYNKSKYAYLYTIQNFNIIGTKKVYSVLELDDDDYFETMLWGEIEKTIDTKPNDSITVEVFAINVLIGKDLETGKPVLQLFK